MIAIAILLLSGAHPAVRTSTCIACHGPASAGAASREARANASAATNGRMSLDGSRNSWIPAFSRKYRTSCSTCHTAAPKLNAMGEAFRLNGYRFPENDEQLRKDEPVPLGEDPWRDLWPKAIWPGELPANFPFALRIQSDVGTVRDDRGETRTDFRMPNELYLLAGATLGDGISVFMESEWTREEGLEIVQAKALFQDIFGLAPHRAANLWFGLQNLYPFTFADRQIDHAGRQSFLWQTFEAGDLKGQAGVAPPASSDEFALIRTQPAIEVNGLLGNRVSYGVGLSQGAGETTQDNNARKDFYYRLRWKIGGLNLRGRYDQGRQPVVRGHGQLLDRSLTIEHFGYLGAEPVAGGASDSHRHFGIAARAVYGVLDAGVGYVWGRYDDPWGTDVASGVEVHSAFAKIEVLAYPWLIPSFKFERFDAEPDVTTTTGFVLPRERQTRLIPGVIALIHQNVRAVLEAEFVPRYQTADPAAHHPVEVWLRLDLAF